MFLGAAEPRKLRVQHRDGLGRSLEHGMEDNSGVWLRLGLSLQTRTPVAGLSFVSKPCPESNFMVRVTAVSELARGFDRRVRSGSEPGLLRGLAQVACGQAHLRQTFLCCAQNAGDHRSRDSELFRQLLRRMGALAAEPEI